MITKRFTDLEIDIVKSTDLVHIAGNLGYTVKRVGNCYFTLKEMDSIRIYNRRTWCRWSRKHMCGEGGGTQIDFLMAFCGLDFKQAVHWLLDYSGYILSENQFINETAEKTFMTMKEKGIEQSATAKELILPKANGNNDRLYSYLMNERYLSQKVVDYFVNLELIYETEQYHNILFKGNDKDSCTRFASMRGTYDKNGTGFKGDVAGNDKNYAFNMTIHKSNEIFIFESAIDLMSYVYMYDDYETNKLALGMVSDNPLERYLQEYPHVKKIGFCLDNDEIGRNATKLLMQKYEKRGYDVKNYKPKKGKDYNEWLQEEIKKRCCKSIMAR